MSRELARFALLAALGEEEQRDLAQELEWLSFEAGASIFREGDVADGLLLLLEGQVLLRSSRAPGVGVCEPGASFGALSLVLDGVRRASLQASTPCRLLRLRPEGFRRLLEMAPRAACRLLEGVVRESADLVEGVLEDRQR
ncbi:MAG: cyclic nucleotide-binding domain-containing protein [Myxococcales bacterium]|nr:cyclic nucleotide-binding domain-containing protein [Myxococcales bacterium]MDH5306736.1 cyclic nucleotide-binding domain-containing protein [Myxococcales bacterium]